MSLATGESARPIRLTKQEELCLAADVCLRNGTMQHKHHGGGGGGGGAGITAAQTLASSKPLSSYRLLQLAAAVLWLS